jgi:hypothetical protein
MCRSIRAIGVFIGSLGLFWTKACVGERVDSVIFILSCINPLFASYKCHQFLSI